jgi:hypothetical protein
VSDRQPIIQVVSQSVRQTVTQPERKLLSSQPIVQAASNLVIWPDSYTAHELDRELFNSQPITQATSNSGL